MACDAERKPIFTELKIPKNISDLIINRKKFSFCKIDKGAGRPSIETSLHCVFNHRFVLHVHAVDCLSLLVKNDIHLHLEQRLGNELSWGLVDYAKPGEKLCEKSYPGSAQM